MLKKINQHIDLIERHGLHVGGDQGVSDLLAFHVKIMPKSLGAERCSIFIHDPTKKEVWLKSGTGVAEREISVPLEVESVVGEVIKTGEPKIIADMDKKDGAHRKTDANTGFVTRNMLCIPIRSIDGKKITGAIQLLNRDSESGFSAEDQELLEEMAHRLQVSLEEIYLRGESATALKKAGHAVGLTLKICICLAIAITGMVAAYLMITVM